MRYFLLLVPVIIFSQSTKNNNDTLNTFQYQIVDTLKKDSIKVFDRNKGVGAYIGFGNPVINSGGFKIWRYFIDLGIDSYKSPREAQYNYPIPHNNFIQDTTEGAKVSLCFGYVFELYKGLEITPLLGFGIQVTNVIDVSTSTGWTYENKTINKDYFSFGGQVVYNIYDQIDIGVRYNNLNGFSLIIGLHQNK